MYHTAVLPKRNRGARIRQEISEDQKNEIKEAFDLFDTDHDQCIDYHEFKVAMRALGFDLKKAEVLKILKDHDRNGSQLLHYNDFVTISELTGHTSLMHLLTSKRVCFGQ